MKFQKQFVWMLENLWFCHSFCFPSGKPRQTINCYDIFLQGLNRFLLYKKLKIKDMKSIAKGFFLKAGPKHGEIKPTISKTMWASKPVVRLPKKLRRFCKK